MPNVGMHGRVGEPAAVVALDVVAAAVVASHVGVVQSHGSDEPGQPPAAEPGQPQAAEGMFTVPENQAVADMVPITHGPQFFEDSKGHWYNAKGNRVDEFGRETHKRGLNNLDRPSKQKWRNQRNVYGRVWWDKRDGDWRGTGTAKWTGGGWQGGGASSSGGSGSGVVAWHGKGGKQ